jgi:hypothetical protein
MGIEQLNKAAEAAGFAMATEEETQPDVMTSAAVEKKPETTLPMVWSGFVASSKPNVWGAVTSATGWVRGYLPSFGGRAPA